MMQAEPRGRRDRFGLSAFGRSCSGATVVEFALLALPFFMMLFVILQTGLIFMGELTLNRAVAKVAREVRVNELPEDKIDCGHFRRRLCEETTLFDCDNFMIDLRTYASYDDIPLSAPIRNGRIDDSGLQCDRGAPDSIMALRVYYRWPLVFDPMRRAVSELNDGTYLMAGTAAFVTEPYL